MTTGPRRRGGGGAWSDLRSYREQRRDSPRGDARCSRPARSAPAEQPVLRKPTRAYQSDSAVPYRHACQHRKPGPAIRSGAREAIRAPLRPAPSFCPWTRPSYISVTEGQSGATMPRRGPSRLMVPLTIGRHDEASERGVPISRHRTSRRFKASAARRLSGSRTLSTNRGAPLILVMTACEPAERVAGWTATEYEQLRRSHGEATDHRRGC